MSLYNVGVYCRLSVEDANNSAKKNYIPGEESSSIENQRTLLTQFARLQGWLVTKTYCDDGYSGRNFSRPAVNEMLVDAKSGVIDLILCKDLSRFGRDSIEVGRYTDVLFPSWGVRFIALLDEIDTARDDNDIMHFRSLMNDYYLRDLSAKVKTVFRNKIQKHGLVTGRPPYGYLKSDGNKHLLIPDPDTVETIRRIFALRADGLSYNVIARTLNNEKVLTANDYWAVRAEKPPEKRQLWSVQIVRATLRNEVYIGTLVNNKKPVLNHKSDRRVNLPESEWIRRPNAHEPLIDRETWDKVQAMEQAAVESGKKQSKHKPSLFKSKLYCAGCGATLSPHGMGHPDDDGVWRRDGTQYNCHKHIMSGRAVCFPHTIGEAPLKRLILSELRGYAEAIVLDEAALLETLKKRMAVDDTKQHSLLRKEVKRLEGRLADLMKITAELYEDKVGNVISEQTFIALMGKNEKERIRWQTQFDEANGRLTAIDEKILSVTKWAEVVRRHIHLEDLTRADVEELIDRVVVGESDYSSGQRVQEIRIFWRFVGCLTD